MRAVLLLAGLFAAAAAAQTAYRFVTPDGRVIYSDQRVPGARLDGTVVTPPAASSPAPVTTLTPHEEALAEAAEARLRVRRLAAQSRKRRGTWRRRTPRSRQGVEAREGERIGTYAGRARPERRLDWAPPGGEPARGSDPAQARLDRAVPGAERASLALGPASGRSGP